MTSPDTPQKFNTRWILVGLAVVSLLVWLGYNVGHPNIQSEQSATATGKQLFDRHCAVCHGSQGVGENPAKVAGGMKQRGGYWAPALNGTAHTWHHPQDTLFQTIKKGSLAEDSQMKGFEGRLDDSQIRQILSYIKSLWPESIRARYNSMHSPSANTKN